MKKAVRKDWNINVLASDLDSEEWHVSEPHRIERTIYLASWDTIEDLAKMHVSEDEWREAEEYGVEHEIVEDYLAALAEAVGEALNGDVYWTAEAGEVFLGQGRG